MSERTATKSISNEQHFHRWRIDEPSGPVSVGTCKECGATKEFKNWLSDSDFITNEEHRVAGMAA